MKLVLKYWQNVDKGIDVNELQWQCQNWSKPRRMIVVRQRLKDRPKASGKLLLELEGYCYSVMLTSFTDLPQQKFGDYIVDELIVRIELKS